MMQLPQWLIDDIQRSKVVEIGEQRVVVMAQPPDALSSSVTAIGKDLLIEQYERRIAELENRLAQLL